MKARYVRKSGGEEPRVLYEASFREL